VTKQKKICELFLFIYLFIIIIFFFQLTEGITVQSVNVTLGRHLVCD